MINGSVSGFWNYITFVVFPVKTWMGRVGQREILKVVSDKNFGVPLYWKTEPFTRL